MRVAVVFPGQGSQRVGAGRAWRDDPAWSVVEDADRVWGGRRASHLLLDAEAGEMAGTLAAQLGVMAASLVGWAALADRVADDEIVALAGHSLGQVTALVAAGVVGAEDGLRLAQRRAEATAAAQAGHPGGMVALFPVDEETAAGVCAAVPGGAWVANVNGAGQVVLGVDRSAQEAVVQAARDAGVRKVQPLPVDGAFHTPLMAPAAEALAPVLATVRWHPGAPPVVANDDATVVGDPTEWPERLRTHLVRPVLWGATVERLRALGAEAIVEVGPAPTLAALARRAAPELITWTVSSPADLLARPW
jgi:[acyl-carrier-protein] S-malonyltransferase